MSVTFYQNQPHPYIFSHLSYLFHLIFLLVLITRNNPVQNIYFPWLYFSILQIGESSQLFLFVKVFRLLSIKEITLRVYTLFQWFFFLLEVSDRPRTSHNAQSRCNGSIIIRKLLSEERAALKLGDNSKLCKNLWNSLKLGFDTLIKYCSRILLTEHLSQQ